MKSVLCKHYLGLHQVFHNWFITTLIWATTTPYFPRISWNLLHFLLKHLLYLLHPSTPTSSALIPLNVSEVCRHNEWSVPSLKNDKIVLLLKRQAPNPRVSGIITDNSYNIFKVKDIHFQRKYSQSMKVQSIYKSPNYLKFFFNFNIFFKC